MPSLIWFNEDGLNPDHQMVKDYADALRVYVFDVPYLKEKNMAKHRVQFIYEALLEIPSIQIYKGEMVVVLWQLIEDLAISEVVTTETPNHIIKGWQDELQKSTNLITYPEIFPVTDDAAPRRFSRYWKKHERSWLTL
jgi:hypothetical protein